MKKEPIIRSPYAFDLNKMISMSKEEKKMLYTQSADTFVKPFTVIDVLRNVYHRDLIDDLSSYVDRSPYILMQLKKSSNDWFIDRYKIAGFRIIRPESIFGQPIEDFMIDILGEATVILSERDSAGRGWVNEYTVKKVVRLRYCFDLRPCELTCQFFGLLTEEKESLYSVFPSAFHLDKYLLPVLSTKKDYERMARYIIENDMPEFIDANDWICGIDWIKKMGIGVYFGEFPEYGVMGEYFFGFGTGKVLDPETRECREELINPGTILLNMDALDTRGKMNSTSTHEGVHHRLAYYYFMLQRTHGGNISSYLCKRYEELEHEKERTTSWTPVDIMELHANKLPAYILIRRQV